MFLKKYKSLFVLPGDKSGVYLYSNNNIGNYFFLNVRQEENAVILKELNYNIRDKAFNIYFSEQELPLAISRKLNGRVIYKIGSSDEYETVRVFRNAKEIPFDAVGT